MNKKIIASVCGAAVLATAVYFGGVYVTGIRINEALNSIEKSIHDEEDLKNAISDLNAKYTRVSEGFFSNEGRIDFELGKLKSSVPLTISKGFLNAEASADLSDALKILSHDAKLKVSEDSIKGNVEIYYNALSRNLDVESQIKADYLNVDNSSFSLNSYLNLNSSEDLEIKVNATDVYDAQGNYVKNVDGRALLEKKHDTYVFTYGKLALDDIMLSRVGAKHFEYESAAQNVTADGDFDISLKLKGDNLVDVIYDYDISLLLSKFNFKDVVEYYKKSKESTRVDTEEFLSKFSLLNIEKLNLRVSSLYGSFIGTRDLGKHNLRGTGSFTFDIRQMPESIKGELKFESDSNTGAESILKEADGKYQAVFSVENGKLKLNGERFL